MDLFCGAGGAGLGLHQAGFEVVAGVDHNEKALRTYNENLSGEPVHHDLADVDTSVLPSTVVDFVHGSPPCQGFSQARGERDAGDERNQLVWSFIEWVDELRPKVVTMENVAGMQSISTTFLDRVVGDGFDGGAQQSLAGETVAEQSETDGFASIGYDARWRLLNCADYGIPQTRERIFVVAVREDVATPSRWFPEPTHSSTEYVAVEEVLEDLVPLAAADKMTDNQNEKHQKEGRRPFSRLDEPAKTVRTGTPPQLIANHQPTDHDEEVRERLATLDKGGDQGTALRRCHPEQPAPTINGGHHSQPVHYNGPVFNHNVTDHSESHKEVIRSMEPGFTGDSVTRRRLAASEPSGTVTCASVSPLSHYREVRRLTARECARLQSFPDSHVFVGGKTAQLKQIGNAVPPKLAYHIGRHLRNEVLSN
ncbi:DNA cytosine methyltransferase [Haloparvum sp. AD34]